MKGVGPCSMGNRSDRPLEAPLSHTYLAETDPYGTESYGFMTIEGAASPSTRPPALVEAHGEPRAGGPGAHKNETETFSAELRMERNRMIARESAIGAAVVVTFAGALIFGFGATRSEGPPAAAQQDTIVADTPAPAPSHTSPPSAPTVEGPVQQKVVEQAVARSHPELDRCYAEGVAHNPALVGTVTIKFLVAETGAILGVADLGSSLPDRSVVRCVARSMRSLTLEPEKSRSLVTYPIQFPQH